MGRQKKSGTKHKVHHNNNKTTSDNHQEIINNPYKVEESPILGRYLVSTRNLPAGEVVVTDEPLVVGPCQEAKPVCVGCYADIDLKNENTYKRCKTCSWPLCRLNCPGYYKVTGHSQQECDLLSRSQLKNKEISSFQQFYYAVTPFRCLLLKDKDSERWKIIQGMEPHTEERRKATELWETNKKMAVDIIRDVWGFKEFSEEEIHFVCGVLEVNAFEVNQPTPGSQCLRAIYPNAYLFAHDCVPNTCHSNTEDFQLIIRMMRTIPPKEMITVSYAYPLQCTLKRRNHLKKTKFFSCSCKRCSDPTELGTYTNAIKCMTCKDGFLIPKNPLDDESSWRCTHQKCKSEMEVTHVIPILDIFFKELDSINGNDVIGYEKYLKRCSTIFHDNHYLVLSAMHCLSQLYGKINGYLINDLTDEQLERKIEICRKLIKMFEKFEPGQSKQRGILLYELQAPLMVMLRRKFQSQNITSKEMKTKVKEILKYLEESSLILSKEPKNSQEGQMAEAATAAIVSLQDWLNLLRIVYSKKGYPEINKQKAPINKERPRRRKQPQESFISL